MDLRSEGLEDARDILVDMIAREGDSVPEVWQSHDHQIECIAVACRLRLRCELLQHIDIGRPRTAQQPDAWCKMRMVHGWNGMPRWRRPDPAQPSDRTGLLPNPELFNRRKSFP